MVPLAIREATYQTMRETVNPVPLQLVPSPRRARIYVAFTVPEFHTFLQLVNGQGSLTIWQSSMQKTEKSRSCKDFR